MYERTYNAKVLKTADEPTRRKRPFPWRRVLAIFMCTVVVFGAVWLIKLPRFQVQSVAVTGTNATDPVDISDTVLESLQGHYFKILPKSSILLIRTSTLAHSIQKAFPRLKHVTVTRTSMHSLAVDVVEYPGVYLWCKDTSTCSFMDETGTVFSDAPYFSGDAYLKVYGGESADYPFHPLTSADLNLVIHLKEKLQAIALTPIEFHFVSTHTVTVMFVHSGHIVQLFFDPTRDIEGELTVLYTGLRTEPLQSEFKDSSKILQYLDLRFSNKIVYKFE